MSSNSLLLFSIAAWVRCCASPNIAWVLAAVSWAAFSMVLVASMMISLGLGSAGTAAVGEEIFGAARGLGAGAAGAGSGALAAGEGVTASGAVATLSSGMTTGGTAAVSGSVASGDLFSATGVLATGAATGGLGSEGRPGSGLAATGLATRRVLAADFAAGVTCLFLSTSSLPICCAAQ